MTYSALSHLDCPRCGSRYDADQVQGTCSCGSPLLARYDLGQVASQVSPREIAGRPADLWRYHELLPVRQAAHVVSLGEGMTPLLPVPNIGQALGMPHLLMKDEGLLPTGTFKARGAAVGVSRAAELGVTAIAMPTNGNAGAAWSVYAARAGMRSLIVMPVDAPPVTRVECAAAGAELYLVDGTIGDAGRLVAEAVPQRPGYQNVATLREPYRIEGKKTMGLEIAEQLGWRMPGVIVYPTGGGVGIIGIYKALRELLELGWVSGDLPRLVAVQAEGCAPIVTAFRAGADVSEPWPEPKTVAFGLTVPKALGDFLVLGALHATGGTAVTVTDEELLADQREVARLEGSFICPEGAACFAAVRRLRASGWLSRADEVVVLNTGTGLIYPETSPAHPPLLPPAGPIPALSVLPGSGDTGWVGGKAMSGRGRLGWFLVVLALLASGCTSTPVSEPASPSASTRPAAVVVPPGTSAGAQLRWLLTATARLPVPDGQVRAHFDAAFLAESGPAVVNQALQGVSGATLASIQVSELNTVVAIVSAGGAAARVQVWLTVDSRGLISELRISPANGPVPGTWAGVDAALRLVAPQVRLLVADVSHGSCQPVHSIDPDTAAPIGAAFKLYVLDALGRAVASGTVGWNQPLTVTTRLKSLPAGELQTEPDGTRVSVLDTAAAMVSLSDNTATDMLINLVGRSAVEAALSTAGMASPALDLPLLTTREIFVLKLRQWPALATRYIAADESSRRALLASTVDQAPLPAVAAAGAWIAPRDINSLEYFASAADLCRAYASLAGLARRPGLAQIGQVLSLNHDSLALDPARWQTTWFKGGSEPGVLTMAYLATTRTGHSYVVTALAENPSQPIDENAAIPVMLSAIKGAFALAARR